MTGGRVSYKYLKLTFWNPSLGPFKNSGGVENYLGYISFLGIITRPGLLIQGAGFLVQIVAGGRVYHTNSGRGLGFSYK